MEWKGRIISFELEILYDDFFDALLNHYYAVSLQTNVRPVGQIAISDDLLLRVLPYFHLCLERWTNILGRLNYLFCFWRVRCHTLISSSDYRLERRVPRFERKNEIAWERTSLQEVDYKNISLLPSMRSEAVHRLAGTNVFRKFEIRWSRRKLSRCGLKVLLILLLKHSGFDHDLLSLGLGAFCRFLRKYSFDKPLVLIEIALQGCMVGPT